MRGKPLLIVLAPVLHRITPADAGKTTQIRWYIAHAEDHPRGCGENSFIFSKNDEILGSPPRMRGKLISAYIIVGYCRITPADAGKTAERLFPFAQC